MFLKLFAIDYATGEPVLRFIQDFNSAPGMQWSEIRESLQSVVSQLHGDDIEPPQIAVYSTSGPITPGCMIAIEAFETDGRRIVMLVNSLENQVHDKLRSLERGSRPST